MSLVMEEVREAPRKISAGGVKKARNEGRKVVTANRLHDGVVVYRGTDEWTEDLDVAWVVEGDAALALLDVTLGEEREVVGPYLMDVDDAAAPSGRAELRERIRAAGPTIHPQFGRQAQEARDPNV
jgi:hypothetical protein